MKDQEFVNIKELELERDIENAIKGRGLQESMKRWEKERASRARRRRYLTVVALITPLAVAAMCVSLVFVVPQRWIRHAENWAYREYVAYFGHPHKGHHRVPVQTTSVETYLAVAESSTLAIQNACTKSPLGENDHLYEATAEILAGNYEAAYDILEEVRKSSKCDEEVDFLEAICNLLIGQDKNARKQLETIANGSGQYSAEAQKILDSMDGK